jgi:hypothetical protein
MNEVTLLAAMRQLATREDRTKLLRSYFEIEGTKLSDDAEKEIEKLIGEDQLRLSREAIRKFERG